MSARFNSGAIELPNKPASTVKAPGNSTTKTLFIDANGILSMKDFAGKVLPVATKQIEQPVPSLDNEQVVVVNIPRLTELKAKHENLTGSVQTLAGMASEHKTKLETIDSQILAANTQADSEKLKLTALSIYHKELQAAIHQVDIKRVEQDFAIENVGTLLLKSTTEMTKFKNRVLEMSNDTNQIVLELNRQLQTQSQDYGVLV